MLNNNLICEIMTLFFVCVTMLCRQESVTVFHCRVGCWFTPPQARNVGESVSSSMFAVLAYPHYIFFCKRLKDCSRFLQNLIENDGMMLSAGMLCFLFTTEEPENRDDCCQPVLKAIKICFRHVLQVRRFQFDE